MATSSTICFPGSPLANLIQTRAKNNRIIITFTNYGFVDLAQNLLACFQREKIQNYLLVALDAKTVEFFQERGETTYLLELKKKLFTEESSNFGTAGFVDICNVKPWLVLEILKGGFDVIWTDTDIVWLNDPQLYFDRRPWADLQVQSDDDDICAGFFYAKSNTRSIRFLERVIDYTNPLIDDQSAMRRFLQDNNCAIRLSSRVADCHMKARGEDLTWFQTRCPLVDVLPTPQAEIDDAIRSNRVSFFVLDRVCFPNGTAYFNAKLPQRLGVTPIIVHNNCIIGHDPKRLRFQNYGLWFLPQGEFSSPAAKQTITAPLQTLKGHTEIVTVLHQAGGLFYTCGHDKSLRTWKQVQPGKFQIQKISYPNRRGGMWALQVDAASNLAYTVGHDRFVQIWDITQDPWKSLNVLKGHLAILNAMRVDFGRQLIFSASDDATVRSWNLSTGEKVMLYRGHADWVSDVTTEGAVLFTASKDQTARAWEISSARCLQMYIGHTDAVRSVIVVGERVYTGSADKTIREWDMKMGDCLRTFKGHTGGVNVVRVANNVLYSGSDDGTIRAWSLETAECLQEYQSHTSCVTTLLLSPETSTFFSGSYDRLVMIWPMVGSAAGASEASAAAVTHE